uniref:Breast cancer anti-estrogen resistance protein 1 n=1 Tax=Globodera pallida TaxID=36090 RepID=A0A183CHE9_GLOPA
MLLSQFVPKRDEEVDAVEEAIRSLEQFDPSEFVSQQYKGDSEVSRAAQQPLQQHKHKGVSPFIMTKVFMARAEPVHLHPSGSANSILSLATDPSATSSPEQLSSHPFMPPPAQRPSAVSSGSATPTLGISAHQLLPSSSLMEPVFSQSMDSINRTPRANSPSSQQPQPNGIRGGVTSELNEFLSRLKDGRGGTGRGEVRRGVTFNDNPVQHFYTPFDGPPPDYSDSDEAMDGGSLTDSEEGGGGGDTNVAAVEAEAQLRKRFLCSQLTDCAKVVDINALKMSQFVAAGIGHGGWRQSHILRHNLAAIRDTVYTVEFALDELVESLGRISLDMRDLRQQNQLRQLARPVKTSLTMLKRIRQSVDATGWSLSALSRPAGCYTGNDALDQFVAILPQLPKDCYKLVQWVYSLSVWRDSASGTTSVFLPSSAVSSTSFQASLHPPPPPPAPFPPRTSSPTSSLLNYYSSESIEDEQNNNNNSLTVPGQGSSTDNQQHLGNKGWLGKGMINRADELAEQQWRSRNGAAAALSNDVMDGGESTSSTSSILTVEEKGVDGAGGHQHLQRYSPDRSPQRVTSSSLSHPKTADSDGDVVMEEDDLQSVLSEATGNDVQTRLADFHPAGGGSSLSSPDQSHQRRVNAELARSLSADQRDLFRLYEPQICSHTSALSRSIEEFFSLVESQREPKLSFQKVQMIFIEGHSLVGIVRVIVRDDAIIQHRPLSAFLEHESARIDSLLNECLATAKVAKAKAQTVPAIQAVCTAVVCVSERAHQLKAFWKLCAAVA